MPMPMPMPQPPQAAQHQGAASEGPNAVRLAACA
jgi:hypothetical protein